MPTDGKRRLVRGEGLVARISNNYRPQLPSVGKDIPEPAVPCHVGTARLEETGDIRTRSVGRAVCRPYSDSEDSDNDVLHADEHDSTVQRVSLQKEWSTQTIVDSCGDGWAQLDDFKWFLPTDVRVGDLNAPESEIETSDSEEMTTQQLLRLRAVTQQCDCVGDLMSGQRTIRWRWMSDNCPPLRIQ